MNRFLAAAAAVVAALTLSSCSGPPHAAPRPTYPGGSTHDTSPRGICRSGVHHTPPDNVVVNRALVAPLSLVKAWILRNHAIDWQTYSSSLRDAPLTERVAICVFSKKDGSLFTYGPGAGAPQPTRAVVEIVRSDDRGGALVATGSVEGMLMVTPSSIRALNRAAH